MNSVKDTWSLFLNGIILGFFIVLPGISGGTAFLILGLYEKLIADLSRINLKPYWPLFCGALAGVFSSAFFFTMLLTSYGHIAAAFLLGLLLASLKTILRHRPSLSIVRALILAAGFLLAFFLADEPIGSLARGSGPGWSLLFFGGVLAGATMLIPGIPGSSVLILLGIYDDLLFYLKDFAFINLFIFGAGSLGGIFFLARALDKLYFHYPAPTAYFFAGLIAGSVRVLWPGSFSFPALVAFLLGFLLIWKWSVKGG